jgi:hypothetical protein
VLTRRLSLAPVVVLAKPAPTRSKRRRRTDHDEYLQMMARIVRAAGSHVGKADPDQLVLLAAVAADVDALMVRTVAGVRESGFRWQSIADVLGVSRQAVQQRFGRRVGEVSGMP